MRIGIDVGGTNTDAVLVDDHDQIIASLKVPTTSSIEQGVFQVLTKLPKENVSRICIGSTHAINAILQCRELYRVGVIRLNGNRSEILPSCISWPKNLRDAVYVDTITVDGGFECDGRSITVFNHQQISIAAEQLRERGAESLAIVGAFSPLYPEQEEVVANIIEDIPITLSHEMGGIGFIERENSAILNCALKKMMMKGFSLIEKGIRKLGYSCPIFISQNNGSMIAFDRALANPILTLSAGSTNSFVGAGKLSGLENAIIVDIGGTSTDVGIIKKGYPRRCFQNSKIGGVDLNFSTPDVLSIALGGGSHIDELAIGPKSCGKDLFQECVSFGGEILTLTDVAISMGQIAIQHVKNPGLSKDHCELIMQKSIESINVLVQRMEPKQKELPVILVGGGAALIPRDIMPSRYHIPANYQVANAFGAALGETSATLDVIIGLDQRDKVLEDMQARVLEMAGSNSRLIDLQIIPYHYMPGNKARVMMTASKR